MADTRSPRYPNISLSEAISKAKSIYDKEHMSPLTPQVAAEAMGYNGLHGASLKTISSLKKYGLLEGRGEDVRLTKAAQVLIIDSPDSADYQTAVRSSALSPEVYSDIHKQFQGVGSERNIAVFLEKQGFKPPAAALVARNYKESVALVTRPAPSPVQELPEGLVEDMAPLETEEQMREALLPRSQRGTPGVFARQHRPPASETIGTASAPFRIVMDGTKLHIVADVDLKGLQLFKQVLDSYETMLKLMGADLSPTPEIPGN